jgi:hypothetical protein
MEEGLPWFRELGPQERSWVTHVAQAGIRAFLDWYDAPGQRIELTSDVFGAAPRDLTRVISLEQTVALVRTTIGVVESAVEELVEPEDRPALREAILRYSREIAFSAAEVYARAAESRGAWDARLEALIVDALLRDEVDESLAGRLAALGWTGLGNTMVIAGSSPSIAGSSPSTDTQGALDILRRAAHHHAMELVSGIHGSVLIAVVSAATEPDRTARLLAPHFGAGPVVYSGVGPGMASVAQAARATINGLHAAHAWPAAPRPISAHDLLPERALAADSAAITELTETVFVPLTNEPTLLETAATYLERAGSLEATSRLLFIHPNTVRYRLKRIAETTGCAITEPRGSFTVRVALVLGRLSEESPTNL